MTGLEAKNILQVGICFPSDVPANARESCFKMLRIYCPMRATLISRSTCEATLSRQDVHSDVAFTADRLIS